MSPTLQPIDLTVAVLVERKGRFLIIEETTSGKRVLTQPGGHIDDGESPEQAAEREAAEEARIAVAIRDLIGAYQWKDASGRQNLRIVFIATQLAAHTDIPADPAIHAVHWMSYAELAARQDDLRSPSVMRCIDDYLAGERQPRSLFADCAVLNEQIETALASAELLTA
ncbi:MAG: NUDIX domain-containing protein [Woeseia sp.]